MQHRKTGRTQTSTPPTTRVGFWRQASLFSRAEVKAITLTRRQQIDRRLQNAQEGYQGGRTALERARDEFWATWRQLGQEKRSRKEEKDAGKKEGVPVIRDKEDVGQCDS